MNEDNLNFMQDVLIQNTTPMNLCMVPLLNKSKSFMCVSGTGVGRARLYLQDLRDSALHLVSTMYE